MWTGERSLGLGRIVIAIETGLWTMEHLVSRRTCVATWYEHNYKIVWRMTCMQSSLTQKLRRRMPHIVRLIYRTNDTAGLEDERGVNNGNHTTYWGYKLAETLANIGYLKYFTMSLVRSGRPSIEYTFMKVLAKCSTWRTIEDGTWSVYEHGTNMPFLSVTVC